MKWRIALLLAVLFVATESFATAETVPQMRLRIFAEAQAQHPDVWLGCGTACVTARVASEPMLEGLAKTANVDITDLAKFSVVRDFEWGIQFEKLYKRPPTAYDWAVSYAPRVERLRYELAASPMIFTWVAEDGGSWTVKRLEYAQ